MAIRTKTPGWDTRDLTTSEIELRQPLDSLQSQWVIGTLIAKYGILRARSVGERYVVVEYDASVVSNAEIVRLLHVCGLTATGRRSTSARRRARPPALRSV